MGSFVYQASQVSAFPSDAYEAAGLDAQASPEDLLRAGGPIAAVSADQRTFEGCAVRPHYEDSRRPSISLLPVDLQFRF